MLLRILLDISFNFLLFRLCVCILLWRFSYQMKPFMYVCMTMYGQSSVRQDAPKDAGGGVSDATTITDRRDTSYFRLARNCLKRDGHRCVISRVFDGDETEKRIMQQGNAGKDDDGNLLMIETAGEFESMEVAHIHPRSSETVAPWRFKQELCRVYT